MYLFPCNTLTNPEDLCYCRTLADDPGVPGELWEITTKNLIEAICRTNTILLLKIQQFQCESHLQIKRQNNHCGLLAFVIYCHYFFSVCSPWHTSWHFEDSHIKALTSFNLSNMARLSQMYFYLAMSVPYFVWCFVTPSMSSLMLKMVHR